MYRMNDLRVPGLGLAAAIPDELMTQPRFDPRVAGAERNATTLRLLKVFRSTNRERSAAAGTRSMAAASPGEDLARA
jgi:hypothetical protein